LKEQVLAFARRAGEGKEEGVSLAEVGQHLGSVSAEEVRKVVQELESDVKIYITVDDDHFQVL
ncbi:MAG: hypothetical protein CMC97_05060, partial [Flavobacteriales bacterium]|nr:hypothetical protein [Flavobacteriales bacterium]